MAARQASPMRQLWYRWKALRLPWRKRFLVGLDLEGNTYWEFADVLSHKGRMRRIVEYPSSTRFSEVKLSPQWHQWLRHTRDQPPSLTEQVQDIVRQQKLRRLAAAADARWEAKPRYIDQPAEEMRQVEAAAAESRSEPQRVENEDKKSQSGKEAKPSPAYDPWKQAATGPGEKWQPEAWTPKAR